VQNNNMVNIIIIEIESFHEKYGWNEDLSILGFILMGIDDPLV